MSVPARPRAAWLVATFFLIAAGPAPEPRLGEQRLDEQRLGTERNAVAARLRSADEAASDAAQRVETLAAEARTAERHLDERAAALAPLLPLAERLALFPAETLLAVPAAPEQAVRGLAVLHGLMRTVERQAAELRTELAQLRAARAALEAALPDLRSAQARQALEGAQLDRELEAARTARLGIDDAAAEAARRAAAEATRAETVGAALDAMAASRARAEQQIRRDAERAERQRRLSALAIARQREAEITAPVGPGVVGTRVVGSGVVGSGVRTGSAFVPVAGPVIRRWGDATDAGRAHGIAFRAPPRARVVAPCAGRVAFAGPFRSFGVLVILDCGAGDHFVLAGLDRLDVEAGVAIRPGDAIGTMPDWDPAASGPHPALYVELRHDGQPVDPSPYLR